MLPSVIDLDCIAVGIRWDARPVSIIAAPSAGRPSVSSRARGGALLGREPFGMQGPDPFGRLDHRLALVPETVGVASGRIKLADPVHGRDQPLELGPDRRPERNRRAGEILGDPSVEDFELLLHRFERQSRSVLRVPERDDIIHPAGEPGPVVPARLRRGGHPVEPPLIMEPDDPPDDTGTEPEPYLS